MTETKGFGQYCPIAVASEVMAERWTPLVLRALFCGATRFNEIQGSVPRMSSALLSRRLKELEFAGIINRVPAASGRGYEYRLTEAGEELFPVLHHMGVWAQKWLRRELVSDKNLDPDVLMWDIRRTALDHDSQRETRRVVCFRLDGVPVSQRFYWMVFEDGDIDLCVSDPGHEVDLWVHASMRNLARVWLGHVRLDRALAEGSLKLDGSTEEIKAFPAWFALSHFGRAELERIDGEEELMSRDG